MNRFVLTHKIISSEIENISEAYVCRGAESAVKVKNFPDRGKISPTINDEKSSLN
jgi:hypothetical protein